LRGLLAVGSSDEIFRKSKKDSVSLIVCIVKLAWGGADREKDIQHMVFSVSMGTLHLAPIGTRPVNVLDIGTG